MEWQNEHKDKILMNFNEDYTVHESSFEIGATLLPLFRPDAVLILLFSISESKMAKLK